MAEISQEAAALLGKMLKLRLYLVFSHGKGQPLEPLLAEHLQYMISLERQGKLFASGPRGAPETGNGMTILRAADEDEARRLAEGDPFVRAGIRDYTIEPWTVMEGAFALSVHFSDGSAKFS